MSKRANVSLRLNLASSDRWLGEDDNDDNTEVDEDEDSIPFLSQSPPSRQVSTWFDFKDEWLSIKDSLGNKFDKVWEESLMDQGNDGKVGDEQACLERDVGLRGELGGEEGVQGFAVE